MRAPSAAHKLYTEKAIRAQLQKDHTMLPLLDIFFLGALAISSINLYPHDIELKPGLEVATVFTAHREWWREDGEGKCLYTGLVVPFARDWELLDETTNTVRPPEPDVAVGQAILVNQKVCEGKEPEVMLRTGETWGTRGILRPGNIINVADVTQAKPDQRPKWFAQVLARAQRLAASDENAKAFASSLEKLSGQKDIASEAAAAVPVADVKD